MSAATYLTTGFWTGNSYPQYGHASASASTGKAHEGHSFFFSDMGGWGLRVPDARVSTPAPDMRSSRRTFCVKARCGM